MKLHAYTALLPVLLCGHAAAGLAKEEASARSNDDTLPFPQEATLIIERILPEDVGMKGLLHDNLPRWIDEQHADATNRAQALAQWTDSFFGAAVQDAERADTFIRVITADQWNRADGHDPKLRVRGQVNLPAISKRVDLIFAGADTSNLPGADAASRSETAGIRLNLNKNRRLRTDATLSVSSSGLVPGVRLRYHDDISENSWFRFTQRFQYDTGRGNRAITELGLNRFIGEGSLLRWKSRARYRQDKGFWDWRSSIIFRQWLADHAEFPSAIEYFIGWGGRDEPELFTTNFRLGMLYRKQWLRPFLYFEVEPNVSLRKDTFEEKRKWVPGLSLRLEVMLDTDLKAEP